MVLCGKIKYFILKRGRVSKINLKMLWSVSEWEKSEFINQEITKNTDTLTHKEGVKQLENREQGDIRSSL